MDTVRVVRGTGTGPTATAAYDAALADANLHQYNLIRVSSVIPAEAAVRRAGTAPSLGSPGDRLHVVEARATDRGRVTAGLAWAKPPDEPGIVYEADAVGEEPAIEEALTAGVERGLSIRSLSGRDVERGTAIATRAAPDEGFATALVLAAYGTGRPIG